MLYMAQSYDINLFFFTPEDFQDECECIHALFFESGKTIRKLTTIPLLIDNHIYPYGRKSIECYKKLGEYAYIPRHKLGLNKLEQYRKITSENKFSHLMVPTLEVTCCSDVIGAFEIFGANEIIVKSYRGNQGKGIVKIEKLQNRKGNYIISSNNDLSEVDVSRLQDFFRQHPLKNHIAQTVVNSRTLRGEPFDVRIRVQRRNGNEHYFDMYPRIGGVGKITSNIHTGGYSLPIKTFLQWEYGQAWWNIYTKLERLGAEFPTYFQRFLNQPFFDLGLDVGIEKNSDANFQLCLFEINSFPGASGNLGEKTGVGTVTATFEYYHYLYDCFIL
ncbi:MAG: YheC/YheD family protein [Gracilibacteraceae bacterium]|nr:YheC/YheD family protein [Gracilibacteraceae bacterium]